MGVKGVTLQATLMELKVTPRRPFCLLNLRRTSEVLSLRPGNCGGAWVCRHHQQPLQQAEAGRAPVL